MVTDRLGIVLGLSLLATSAIGQTQPAAATTAPQQGEPAAGAPLPPIYAISTAATYQPSTNLHDTGSDNGSFTQARYGASGLVAHPITGTNLFLTHALAYEYDQYDFTDQFNVRHAGQSIPASPWSDTQLLSYTLQANYYLDKNWNVFGGPIVGLSWENGADVGNAWNCGGLAGAGYHASQNFDIGIGAILTSGLEEDLRVLPLVQVHWKISDTWTLGNVRPEPGLRGTAGLELAWQFAPRWTVAGGGAYDVRRFRLADDQTVESGGVGQNSSFPIYARLLYKLDDHWSFSAIGGAAFGGQLQVLNDSGHKIGDVNYDLAPFVAISAGYRF